MTAPHRALGSTLTGIFAPGSPALFESLRTLVVTPRRNVTPGETIRVEFSFSNLGGASATGVRVRFGLPPGVSHVPGTDAVDATPLPDGMTLVATEGAALADLAPNAQRTVACSFRVNEPVEDGTELAFQAALVAEQASLVASNIERLVVRSAPVLQNTQTLVTIVASDHAKPSDTIAVRATIANTGQSSATDVVVILPLPEYTTYVPRSARVAGRALLGVESEPFDYASETIVAQRLTPGQSVVVEYQATIDAPLPDGTRLRVAGVVASREVVEFPIQSSEILVNSPVDFENDETKLTLHCDDMVTPGMRVPMTMRAVNTGTGGAQQVAMSFELPPGLVYTPGSAHVDGQPVSDESFAENVFSLGSLPAGRVVDVGLSATVAVPSSDDVALPVSATLRWKGSAGAAERRFARRLSVRVAPRFTRARNYIDVDRGVVRARDEVLFTAHVFNDGTAPERNVSLRLIPGAFLEDVRIAHVPDESLPYLEPVALGSIAPHSERVFAITARVASPVPDRSQATLGAVLEFEAGDFDLGVGTIVVRSRPQLEAESCTWELVGGADLRPGQSRDIVIRFTNGGSDVLRDARMELTMPAELALERAQNARRELRSLHFGDIPANTTHEAHLTVRLLGAPKRERVLVLAGSLAGRGVSPVQFHALEIPVFAEAKFTAGAELRSNPADLVNAGERVTYELRLHNTGDGPSEQLTVRTIPSNLAVYVPGSTAINGLNVADDLGASQLWSQRGLMLTDVNPNFELRIRWEMIVMSPLAAGTAVETRVVVDWDDAKSVALSAPTLRVVSSPSLEATAAGTPISIAQIFPQFDPPAQEMLAPEPAAEAVTGAAAAEPQAEPARAPEPGVPVEDVAPSPTLFTDFSQEQLAAMIRTLEKSDAGGLMQHIFAIKNFFPHRVGAASADVEANAQTAARTMRAPLDRLFVRLHLPRLTVTAKDLEDRDSRYALRALVDDVIARAQPGAVGERARETVRLSGSIDVSALRALVAPLETAPLGAVVPWIAYVRLLGDSIESDSGRTHALGSYRAELLRVFSLLETLPIPEFHRVLTSSVNRSLDASLQTVVEELRGVARVAVD
ncbi:MAG TPA: hypothetical protein VIG32_07345 [Candidatus Baltobacteraceae bacterium]